MYTNKRRIHLFYLVFDLIIIALCFYLPYRFNPRLVPQDIIGLKSYSSVFVIWGVSLIFLLNNFHLYSTDRSLSISEESLLVIRCILLSSILAALFIFGLKIDIFSRLVFLEITALLAISLPIWRTAKRIYVRYLILRGYFNYNILVIGAGKAGLALSEEIRNNPYLGLKIVGFLDDEKTEHINGFKILGKTKDLVEIIKRNFIDEVYITIPSERKTTSMLLLQAIKTGTTVRLMSERFDLPYQPIKLNYIGLLPLITYFERDIRGSEQLAKRVFDIMLSGAALFLLFPLFIAISVAIKLESPGPVLYISQRCGRKGKVFNFYKFRSMVYNADSYKDSLRGKSEVKGPIFKIRNDPRITRFGKFLRKHSLDELPQLFNVLKGDMSLVGPRPLPVDESQRIENKHLPRLNIQPGLTGLAQVKGRSDLPFHQWAKWDIWYFNHWSLGLDLQILWWTIPAVIKGKGAY